MKNKKNLRTVLSHDDIQRAVKRFLTDGGIIVHLPEQQNQAHTMVGGEKYQNYETLSNLVSK